MFNFTDKFDIIKNDEITLKIIQKYNGDSEILPFYYYEIICNSTEQIVGKISIRIGNNFHSYYNGNIGYEVFKQFRGNNYAFKACLLIFTVARFHRMQSIYITCDESNISSYKTIEKLGAQLVEICNVPREYFAWHDNIEKQRIYQLSLIK